MMEAIYNNYGKRFLDIIGASILLITLAPIILLSAIAVKVSMGKPILHKPKRPGKNTEIFTMYKFRTMTNDKDDEGNLLPDVERITKTGRFMRKTSLDELPELYNILKGEMSFVGPRPLSVKYIPYYNKHENKRHNVRPGLTGYAQVNGRNNLSWEERFEKDIYYVNNMSFLLDLKIIINTIFVTLSRKDIITRGTGKLEDFHIYRMKNKKRD